MCGCHNVVTSRVCVPCRHLGKSILNRTDIQKRGQTQDAKTEMVFRRGGHIPWPPDPRRIHESLGNLIQLETGDKPEMGTKMGTQPIPDGHLGRGGRESNRDKKPTPTETEKGSRVGGLVRSV